MELLQQYWWIIISVLAGLLVFLLFVQGGQSMLYTVAKNEDEKDLVINVLGRKWEFTFTTLVVFGGAFFAAFPLFYSTSFAGAYPVWMLILFCFVIQAVSFEYRKKKNNWLGQRTFEIFLLLNGILAPILIGMAVATFFTGSPFTLGERMNVIWDTPWRGLDALFVFENYLLGLAIFFLARSLAALFFINSIGNDNIFARSKKQLLINFALFLVTFLSFLGFVLLSEGFSVDSEGIVSMVKYKYFYNLIEMPINTALFLIGVVLVLFGAIKTILQPKWTKGIWFAGIGTIVTVVTVFIIAGFNGTAFYPSSTDLQSSLTIQKASSSEYTLKAMAYVSIAIPFVLGYIWYAWKALTNKPITKEELNTEEHTY